MHVARLGKGAILLALTACAGMAGMPSRVYQADYRRPERRDVVDEAEWSVLSTALLHLDRARNAQDAGNLDQARGESRSAAEALANYLQKFPSSDWRLVAARLGVQAYLESGQHEEAALLARKMLADPAAQDVSKAYFARQAAAAWQQQGLQQARTGKGEGVKIVRAAQRGSKPLQPRPPPEVWKRYVEAADIYAQYEQADPYVDKATGQPTGGAASPGYIALVAAQVEFAFDNVEDARRRFERIIERYPGDPAAMEGAVPLYLDTFLVQGDDAGFDAALKRVEPVVRREAEKAAQAAKAQLATEEQKRTAETFARLAEALVQQKEGAGFTAAAKLLGGGKNREAAEAFEKFAAGNPRSPDAPAALYNASIARDRLGEADKAQALRARVLAEFSDASVAPQATVVQAQSLGRKEDHAGAQKLYARYLERWPAGEQRCIALQNIGVEQWKAGRTLEAAGSFVRFGSDKKCSQEDPNAAATYLFSASLQFRKAGKKADEKAALQALVALEGVTGTVPTSQLEEGKRRLKALK